MTKEECEKALETLNYLGDFKDGAPALLENEEPKAYGVIKQLIKEHFELLEVLKDCGFGELTPKGLKVVIEAGQYSSKKLNELRNPQPYKLEELKPDMFVFDCIKNRVNKIIEIFEHDFGIPYIKFDDGFGEWFIVEFEEWRFFPVTKAMEY